MEAQPSWGSPHSPLRLASWWPVLRTVQGHLELHLRPPQTPTSQEDSRSCSYHLARMHRGERAALDTFERLRQTHGASGFTHVTSEGNLIVVGYGHHFPSLLCIRQYVWKFTFATIL